MFRNLIAEQARAGLTNQQVADYLGVSRSGYEAKKRAGRFSVVECSKLCWLFGCKKGEIGTLPISSFFL